MTPQSKKSNSSKILAIAPPESGFYAKLIDFQGIAIKAPSSVADQALLEAESRLEMMLKNIPDVVHNLKSEGVELHIIGKDQVTSDLPEHRHLKGKDFEGGLDVDQRTRGLGGLLVSCGEENLLRLENDRYFGRDICVHEFVHVIRALGIGDEQRREIANQHQLSIKRGLWKGTYAATNDDEFFSELAMWYFGTHGDLGKITPKPQLGSEWLQTYDPDAFRLLEQIFSGRSKVPRSSIVQLANLPVDREGQLKSLHAENPTTIRFLNRTTEEVQVFWLDYEGKRKLYGKIEPSGRFFLNTFATHPWILVNGQGKSLSIFIAQTEAGIGVLVPG